MVYLIGIDHGIQHNLYDDSRDADAFRIYIKKLIKEKKIKIIAEESSQEYLKEKGITETIVQKVSKSFNIDFIFADPDRKERIKLGIKSRENIAKELGIYRPNEDYTEMEKSKINIRSKNPDKLREEEWFNRIKLFINKNILFICGSGHVENFCSLIKEKEVSCEILFKNFSVDSMLSL